MDSKLDHWKSVPMYKDIEKSQLQSTILTRPSSTSRIALGTLLTGFVGANSGRVWAVCRNQISRKWIMCKYGLGGAALGASFCVANEVLFGMSMRAFDYSNYWINYTLAGVLVSGPLFYYQTFVGKLIPEMGVYYCKKHIGSLVCAALFFDIVVELFRKHRSEITYEEYMAGFEHKQGGQVFTFGEFVRHSMDAQKARPEPSEGSEKGLFG
mmetsp:Transcript_21789/g.24652  ORF Transcript_21789/g.24652 Transcript_21789/m.24652 type:complete len:211 (-) Transcript_21789:284-916(-)